MVCYCFVLCFIVCMFMRVYECSSVSDLSGVASPCNLFPVCIDLIYDFTWLSINYDMIYVPCLILWILQSATWNKYPNSKINGANMEATWGRTGPRWAHVGLMDLAIWVYNCLYFERTIYGKCFLCVCVGYASDSVLLVWYFDIFHDWRLPVEMWR